MRIKKYPIYIVFLLVFAVIGIGSQNVNTSEEEEELEEEQGHLEKIVDDIFIQDVDDTRDIPDIPEPEQDNEIAKAEKKCAELMRTTKNDPNSCPVFWDTILCWPATEINKTVSIRCPTYIDMFNTKNNATKHCFFDANSSHPNWTKTVYTDCLKPPEVNYTTTLKKHMKYIFLIRIIGYSISIFTLVISIFTLLLPRLRCPRNFVHLNLFFAYVFRIILVVIVNTVLNIKAFAINPISSNKTSDQLIDDDETIHGACRAMMSIYRYSESVYYVAIFSEALYLVLLLKYPYYSERKGARFCIALTWALPIIWLLPWMIAKATAENFWCWQLRSRWNLFLKVPTSVLLIANIFSAVYIIRILYSKMLIKNLTKEKLIKYRRLARSIILLVPIFGLHFIVFAWLPYVHIIVFIPTLEIATAYAEIIFNAFQGLVVSIACCFIHREVRIELLLFICETLKKIKCLRSSTTCMKFLESDYLRKLRVSLQEKRQGSIMDSSTNVSQFRRSQSQSTNPLRSVDLTASLLNGEAGPSSTRHDSNHVELNVRLMDPDDAGSTNNTPRIDRASNLHAKEYLRARERANSSRRNSIASYTRQHVNSICCCLFTPSRNDFYQSSSSKRFRRKASIRRQALNQAAKQAQLANQAPRSSIVATTVPDKALTPTMLSSFMDEVFEIDDLIDQTETTENKSIHQNEEKDDAASTQRNKSCDRMSTISEPVFCSRV